MQVVRGAAHLIPYEQPQALAALINGHATNVALAALPAHFATLLASDRVSHRTRATLLDRMRAPASGSVWTTEEQATVAALVAQILPDCDGEAVLADRILAGIADGAGDGWRFAALPPDREAWRRGLATLTKASGGFAALHRDAQTRLLERVNGGEVGSTGDITQLSPEQMVLWFEDVRAETVRVWMSLPATMAAIGYDGFAVGGDGRRKQGYIRTGANDPEAWQQARERLS